MTVKSGQAVTVLFATSHPTTGAATNGDALPTGTLYVNGTSNAAVVTVTNITTGVYKAALTLPSLTAGDVVSLRIAATVNAIAGEGVVWQEVADTERVSDLTDEVIGTGAGLTALGDTRLANLDAAVSTRSTYAGGAVASVTGAVGSVTGAVTLAADQAVNVTKIAGAAVNTALAQVGANVVSQANIDFGALQKTSLNAATPASVTGAVGSVTGAVGSVTGNVGGNVVGSVGSVAGNVVGSVGSVVGLTASNLDATVSSRSTYAPATDTVETGITWAEWAKVLGAVLGGVASGGGTTTVVFKALDNAGTTRVTATVDTDGNRSSVTLNV